MAYRRNPPLPGPGRCRKGDLFVPSPAGVPGVEGSVDVVVPVNSAPERVGLRVAEALRCTGLCAALRQGWRRVRNGDGDHRLAHSTAVVEVRLAERSACRGWAVVGCGSSQHSGTAGATRMTGLTRRGQKGWSSTGHRVTGAVAQAPPTRQARTPIRAAPPARSWVFPATASGTRLRRDPDRWWQAFTAGTSPWRPVAGLSPDRRRRIGPLAVPGKAVPQDRERHPGRQGGVSQVRPTPPCCRNPYVKRGPGSRRGRRGGRPGIRRSGPRRPGSPLRGIPMP